MGHQIVGCRKQRTMLTTAFMQDVVNTFVTFLSQVTAHAAYVTARVVHLDRRRSLARHPGINHSALAFSQREFRAHRAAPSLRAVAFRFPGIRGRQLMRLFRTHPPLEYRITALENTDEECTR